MRGTILKLALIMIILLFLAASCTAGETALSPSTTIPLTTVPTPTTAPTPTVSPSPTATATPTVSPSPTATAMPTVSPTPNPIPQPTSLPHQGTKTVTLDFDTVVPRPSVGQGTPLTQTSSGVIARFTSAAETPAFSVQTANGMFLTLSQFGGNFLYQNGLFRTTLNIGFSQALTSIKMTFATVDSHGPGNVDTPTSMKLTAYMNSSMSAPVGTATARGDYSSDSYPQGKLLFDSGGSPFNLVVLELVPQPRGATMFLVDNITVTTGP